MTKPSTEIKPRRSVIFVRKDGESATWPIDINANRRDVGRFVGDCLAEGWGIHRDADGNIHVRAWKDDGDV